MITVFSLHSLVEIPLQEISVSSPCGDLAGYFCQHAPRGTVSSSKLSSLLLRLPSVDCWGCLPSCGLCSPRCCLRLLFVESRSSCFCLVFLTYGAVRCSRITLQSPCLTPGVIGFSRSSVSFQGKIASRHRVKCSWYLYDGTSCP